MKWGSKFRSTVLRSQSDDDSRSTWGKVLDTATSLGDVAEALLMARGRLRPMDYAAIGMRAAKTGLSIYHIWSQEKAIDLSMYFNYDGSPWKLAPYFASMFAFEGMDIQEQLVESHQKTKNGKIVEAAYTAIVDGVEIGWVSSPGLNVPPDVLFCKQPDKIANVAARRLWERAGEDRILRVEGTNAMPYIMPPNVVETDFLKLLEKRALAFYNKNVARAMVMDGEPGTGKTTAVGYLARKLELRTVIIAAAEFMGVRQARGNDYYNSGTEFMEVLKPDIVIINDIDRVHRDQQLQLLDIFDNAKSYARLVFATTNHHRNLIEPVRRPGRLDDVIEVPGLSKEEILYLAPELESIADAMVGWPIAYICDMKDRFKVLGDEGVDELEKVAARLEEVREDGKYGRHSKYPTVKRMGTIDVHQDELPQLITSMTEYPMMDEGEEYS